MKHESLRKQTGEEKYYVTFHQESGKPGLFERKKKIGTDETIGVLIDVFDTEAEADKALAKKLTPKD